MTVAIKEQDGEEKQYTFTIVGTGEIGVEDGLKISFESPVGQAVRGGKAGQTVKMGHEGSRKDVKIIAVE